MALLQPEYGAAWPGACGACGGMWCMWGHVVHVVHVVHVGACGAGSSTRGCHDSSTSICDRLAAATSGTHACPNELTLVRYVHRRVAAAFALGNHVLHTGVHRRAAAPLSLAPPVHACKLCSFMHRNHTHMYGARAHTCSCMSSATCRCAQRRCSAAGHSYQRGSLQPYWRSPTRRPLQRQPLLRRPMQRTPTSSSSSSSSSRLQRNGWPRRSRQHCNSKRL